MSSDVLLALGFEEGDNRITTAAVCLYPSRVADAVSCLKKMGMADKIPVASGICMCVLTVPSNSTAPLFEQIVINRRSFRF